MIGFLKACPEKIYIYIYIVHTVIIEDIQELFQIEDAFWGCGQTLFK